MKRLLSLLILCSLGLSMQTIEGASKKTTKKSSRKKSNGKKKSSKRKAKTTSTKKGKVVVVKNKAHLNDLMGQGKPVMVKYKAEWCGACTMIAKDFEKLAQEFKDMIFAEVDVDKTPKISDEHKVRAMPTIHVFKDGKKVDETIGANKDLLRNLAVKHSAGKAKKAKKTRRK